MIQIVPGRRSHNYGIAFDIGTTTIAAYLLDLRTGEEKAVAAGANPPNANTEQIYLPASITATQPRGGHGRIATVFGSRPQRVNRKAHTTGGLYQGGYYPCGCRS